LGFESRSDRTLLYPSCPFATWAEECTDYPDGVREAALAHKYKSETTAAYQRGQKLEKRRVLMKDWAQFLAGSNVVRLDKAG